MIEYKCGDILQEDAEALINTVNCSGVMGRGIALQFKKAFPENFKAYATACKHNEVQPGKMFVFQTTQPMNPRYIINFPTKRHWRNKSLIEDIEAGLKALVKVINQFNIQSIAIPPLGSGLGGLDWKQVKPKIEGEFKSLDPNIRIVIYEPNTSFQISSKMNFHQQIPNMTAGRAALIKLIHHYLNVKLDPFITLLEVHKLMYFMQEIGEPLRLKFEKAKYGPYAENLRHVLHAIEGHFISGYHDGGDAPNKPLEPIPGAIEEATNFLKHHKETQSHLDKVVKLVEGFESPFGLELLSTVHWISKSEKVNSIEDIIQYTYAWNDHKQFTQRQIKLAFDVLVENSWVEKI